MKDCAMELRLRRISESYRIYKFYVFIHAQLFSNMDYAALI